MKQMLQKEREEVRASASPDRDLQVSTCDSVDTDVTQADAGVEGPVQCL